MPHNTSHSQLCSHCDLSAIPILECYLLSIWIQNPREFVSRLNWNPPAVRFARRNPLDKRWYCSSSPCIDSPLSSWGPWGFLRINRISRDTKNNHRCGSPQTIVSSFSSSRMRETPRRDCSCRHAFLQIHLRWKKAPCRVHWKQLFWRMPCQIPTLQRS